LPLLNFLATLSQSREELSSGLDGGVASTARRFGSLPSQGPTDKDEGLRMEQRIVEILMFVIGEIQSRRINVDQFDGVSDDLLKQGFSKREVATAFSVFANRLTREIERVHVGEPSNLQSFRVLHEIEAQYVSPAAYGYLLHLIQLGVISHADMEELLERCMMVSAVSMETEDVKILVATYLFEKESFAGETGIGGVAARPSPDLIH
jgi:uncharacterized protein Smg (DUF494 family)